MGGGCAAGRCPAVALVPPGILRGVVLSRRWSAFLIGVAVWSWLVWPRFAKAILDDERSFDGGSPTSFLWIHAVLIVSALAIGTTVGVLGVKGWRRASR